ncbi:hypothetical protein [Aureimonas pseudogalii]|uniref:Uncharacterized protein n=1 Tax=Aureimonas pseudogalii TaxID=1744844 RepID=A0A7W6MMA5_9HYPH|nr:hypothetical protein [Aureimonas pseudogalii]MBB4000630.1 hypothetical protein [Aureimonas pseudogalii]
MSALFNFLSKQFLLGQMNQQLGISQFEIIPANVDESYIDKMSKDTGNPWFDSMNEFKKTPVHGETFTTIAVSWI